MNTFSRQIVGTVVALALCQPISADETKEKTPHPGYRPESELAADFIRTVTTAAVRVYPTIIRTPTNTFFSTESQEQIVEFLNRKKITKAIPADRSIDPGELKGRGQFDWFTNDETVIGNEVKKERIREQYALVMEVLFPPQRGNRQSVFGIHCIVLDTEGRRAFSFLLNSHHQMFVDTNMVADDLSNESRAELVHKATALGLDALSQHIQMARLKTPD
ncbi:MAG: hypothetical protein HKP10_00750 [Kiritimatiellales bacterium]|nr:hypothetical protein [Kiritimatiellales bacterium]